MLLLSMDTQRRSLRSPGHWCVCVCGRARRVQLQVAHGMRELLLSVAVRSSSKCTVPSTGCQAWLSSGGGNVALWKGSDV